MALSKEHKKTIQQIVDDIREARIKFEEARSTFASTIQNQEAELTNISDSLQEQFEEMSEKAQEGDKGQELQAMGEEIGGVIDKITDFDENSDFEDDVQTIIDGLDALIK